MVPITIPKPSRDERAAIVVVVALPAPPRPLGGSHPPEGAEAVDVATQAPTDGARGTSTTCARRTAVRDPERARDLRSDQSCLQTLRESLSWAPTVDLTLAPQTLLRGGRVAPQLSGVHSAPRVAGAALFVAQSRHSAPLPRPKRCTRNRPGLT